MVTIVWSYLIDVLTINWRNTSAINVFTRKFISHVNQ